MESAQPVAYLIAVGLLLLAGYYGWQQVGNLRHLSKQTNLSDQDRSYHRNQAVLRLACSTLMALLAGLIAGAYASGMEQQATELGQAMQAQREQGQAPVLDAEQVRFRQIYGGYWIGVLLLLFLTLVLAGLDIIAIWRYRGRHLRQIASDRREMIEKQVAILRTQRNGHQD